MIDHQTHWYPRAAFELLLDRPDPPRVQRSGTGYIAEVIPGTQVPFPEPFVELEHHVADMNAHGVTAMVSSPAVWLGDASLYEPRLATELSALLNEEAARAQAELPGRFFGLAVLPLEDVDAALAELEHAAALNLAGVLIHSNLGGRPISTPELMPIYERIAALELPLFLHPTVRTALSPTYGDFGLSVERINWFFDTSAAALALIYGGVLDACPTLTVVHPHLGGVLPFLAGRIASLAQVSSDHLELPADQYLRRNFWVDSITETPGALALAAALYGSDRIVMGTDYPWFPRAPALEMAEREHSAALTARLPALAVA